MSAVPVLGVVEGFYVRLWIPAQRGRLFARMAAWEMNTYLYAPKDGRWHRQLGRIMAKIAAHSGLTPDELADELEGLAQSKP